eukprot:g45923.t1
MIRKFSMSIRTLTNFYRYATESILPGCITAWYGNCSAQDRKKLQRVLNTAQSITKPMAADFIQLSAATKIRLSRRQNNAFFLRQLRKFGMPIKTLTNFYRCTIESIPIQDHKVMCTAQTIMEANLPSIDSIYMARFRGKAANIIKDPSHPGNYLLQPLPS